MSKYGVPPTVRFISMEIGEYLAMARKHQELELELMELREERNGLLESLHMEGVIDEDDVNAAKGDGPIGDRGRELLKQEREGEG